MSTLNIIELSFNIGCNTGVWQVTFKRIFTLKNILDIDDKMFRI